MKENDTFSQPKFKGRTLQNKTTTKITSLGREILSFCLYSKDLTPMVSNCFAIRNVSLYQRIRPRKRESIHFPRLFFQQNLTIFWLGNHRNFLDSSHGYWHHIHQWLIKVNFHLITFSFIFIFKMKMLFLFYFSRFSDRTKSPPV